MYVSPNFKTKRDLKEAVARGEHVTIFQPGPFGGNEPRDGNCCAEGPHFPEPHKWYASITLVDGKITKVK